MIRGPDKAENTCSKNGRGGADLDWERRRAKAKARTNVRRDEDQKEVLDWLNERGNRTASEEEEVRTRSCK